MTAKRFKKKIMSFGVGRNNAEILANSRPKHLDYTSYYAMIIPSVAFTRLDIAVKKSTASIKVLVECFADLGSQDIQVKIVKD